MLAAFRCARFSSHATCIVIQTSGRGDRMRLRAWTVLPIIGAFAACDGGDEAAREASPRIETERLSSIVRELASDQYEGRAPGTPGGRKTVEYLVRQFSELGLEPGGIDGG